MALECTLHALENKSNHRQTHVISVDDDFVVVLFVVEDICLDCKKVDIAMFVFKTRNNV
jgi:hypothetical protein